MLPVLPAVPGVPPVPAAGLLPVLALVVLGHAFLYAWAEWRLRRHRRRRRAILAGLPGNVGEILGWAVAPHGAEVLLFREAGGRLRAAGTGVPRREEAVVRWLVAEGFIAPATTADAAGEGGGENPGASFPP